MLVKLFRSVFASALASLLIVMSVGAQNQPKLTPEQQQLNLQSFDKIWETVKTKHYDPTLGGLDWQAVRDELRPRIEKADTMQEARRILRDMLGRLKQSHFEIFPADEYEEDSAAAEGGRDTTAGIHARVVKGKALVTRVEENSAAAKLGVKTGWEISQVNGKQLAPDIKTVAQKYRHSALLESRLAWLVMLPMSGRLGERVSIEFRDGKNRLVNLEIPFAQRPGYKFVSGNLPPRYVLFESKMLNENVGYIRLNTWLDPPVHTKAFDEALKKFEGAEGIVFDLRGARGGLATLPAVLAGRLIKEPNQSLGVMFRQGQRYPFAVQPQPDVYEKPLAILVDGLTRSASETFASGLQELGRARVFGTRTAGALLPSVTERLPNGDSFQYVIADYTTPKGKRIEGVGVIPDVVVLSQRQELLAGRDPVLDAATKWFRSGAGGAPR